MAEVFGAGEGTLKQAATMVRDAKGDFDKLAADLSNRITGAQNQWAGSGGRAFFQLHQAWTEKQRTIVAALNEFEQSLQSTERDNLSTDDSQMSTMNQFSNRLG